jgi:hypothetical protein
MLLLLSNHCGKAIQNGIDRRANSIASPMETMIKSINQAMNRSIYLANTIVSVLIVSEDDDGEVVCVIVVVAVVFLLSSANTIIPAIKIIIPATIRTEPAIIPLNEFRLT